ncbi:glucosidase [Nostoc sp. C117]|uniref:MGH1-like glycoside hydrolase domain-containing protein n=1 Tax=Nostoc sp. C117 TaxID=3349875 RepID=UPI00370DC83F
MTQIEQIEARKKTEEVKRLVENLDKTKSKYWKRWGPYISDRQWGTVREDYSTSGEAWDYFPHDQARSRAYRWGEDGIAGICDNHQQLCFSIALWNGVDPILKERLFGLTGGKTDKGNHGEDVKEYYFYLDNTPTHAYMKCLYKYPQAEFPYNDLISVNGRNNKTNPEYELLDTKVFENNRYFDVVVEYAKNTPEDILIKISVTNQGPEAKKLYLLPTLWFRNTWSWGLFNLASTFQNDLDSSNLSSDLQKQFKKNQIGLSQSAKVEVKNRGNTWLIIDETNNQKYTLISNFQQITVYSEKPSLYNVPSTSELKVVEVYYPSVKSSSRKWLYCQQPSEMLYTENETNRERFGWGSNPSPYVKDGINNYIVHGQHNAVNPNQHGTKVSASYELNISSGETKVVYLRLSDEQNLATPFSSNFETIFKQRKQEADDFYQAVNPYKIPDEMRDIQRQAFAGMLWSKQFYNYIVNDWLKGDPAGPPPQRQSGRNSEWTHLFNEDIISMPDKWEYPWFAAWDLAFHTIAFALIDPDFAKDQIRLLTREWYMHPNGQMPAYEWAFGDVNPPVHAWATWRIYKIEEKMYGQADVNFLEEVFQKLTLYFTWWTNRKDADGKNLFSGGFLGLDNIGPIDRSNLGDGESLEQSDGTAWMAMYCLKMLKIASELAAKTQKPVYKTMASKFFQHFLLIADAMNKIGGSNIDIWDDKQGFYQDILSVKGKNIPINVRSMVGLIPLFAVETIDQQTVDEYLSDDFKKRFDWFLNNRPDLTQHENISLSLNNGNSPNKKGAFLSLVRPQTRLKSILQKMLDENEFLSPYGIRSVSKYHLKNPFYLQVDGNERGKVNYEPAESTTYLFGGNSNWRGPIWFPVNFLIIESLQTFNYFLGNDFKVKYPTVNGTDKSLWDVATDISLRLINIFLKDNNGNRPVYGGKTTLFGANNKLQSEPDWQNNILFYEYFHGDNGAGIGASHQTGWTGVIAKLIQQYAEYGNQDKTPDTL